MAKLGKQKFNLLGDHNAARTTSAGTIELYLYYSTEDDYFYFDPTEMKQYFHVDDVSQFASHTFGKCNTKAKAVSIIESLISKEVKETRKLRIEIGMKSDLYNIKNPKYKEAVAGAPMKDWNFEQPNVINTDLPSYVRDMLGRASVSGHGLSIEFHRIMEVEVNGIKRYAECDKDWNYKRKDLYGHNFNLIDWTPEAEKFLIETQDLLDSLCVKVLNFFNAGDKSEDLLLKMSKNNKLLGEGGK